jgi:hypothetical protein
MTTRTESRSGTVITWPSTSFQMWGSGHGMTGVLLAGRERERDMIAHLLEGIHRAGQP